MGGGRKGGGEVGANPEKFKMLPLPLFYPADAGQHKITQICDSWRCIVVESKVDAVKVMFNKMDTRAICDYGSLVKSS